MLLLYHRQRHLYRQTAINNNLHTYYLVKVYIAIIIIKTKIRCRCACRNRCVFEQVFRVITKFQKSKKPNSNAQSVCEIACCVQPQALPTWEQKQPGSSRIGRARQPYDSKMAIHNNFLGSLMKGRIGQILISLAKLYGLPTTYSIMSKSKTVLVLTILDNMCLTLTFLQSGR